MDAVFPTDLLIEIFSHLKSQYAGFRRLSKSTKSANISWDGWDALIAQGYSVKIARYKIIWKLDGKLHSFLDLPAWESTAGLREWYKDGEVHRDNDLPAIVWPDREKGWYRNGKPYRWWFASY